LGLYLVMLSVTGSVLVYRRELNRMLARPGVPFSDGQWALLKVAELHDDLLLGVDGQWWNGVASLLVTVLVLTGLIVWWPGSARWRRGLGVKLSGGWRRANWDLHSAMGFWLFLFLLMWGVSGFYLGVPGPFTRLSDLMADEANGGSVGDTILFWLARLHFGRWRTPWLQAVWAAVGLVPAIMFVTGVIMWWNRVLRPRAS
jgi:uncharacterized iron-regulated membrane protein